MWLRPEHRADEARVTKEEDRWFRFRCYRYPLFYGKSGEFTGSDREAQEVSVLALHLLQSALVHVNTLLLQEVLAEPEWSGRMTDEDRRALSPLFWAHVDPYGRFVLDMDSRLDLAAAVPTNGPPASYPESHNEQAYII